MPENNQCQPKISVVMSTIRTNFPMPDKPSTFIFEPTLQSLDLQTFEDFEFVVVDHLIDSRPDCLKGEHRFPIKHIRPKPSVWDRLRYPALGNGFNTGILHSNGELVVVIGDCSEFDPLFLEKYWKHYKAGYIPSARWNKNSNHGDIRKGGEIAGEFAWGYVGYPLKSLFKVNGFDELYDGAKGCIDADLGIRLGLAGHKFIIDEELTVHEFNHSNPYDPKRLPYQPSLPFTDQKYNYLCGKEAKTNHFYYGMLRHRKDFFANSKPMETAVYRKLTGRGVKPIYVTHALHHYLEQPPVFNLEELWKRRILDEKSPETT